MIALQNRKEVILIALNQDGFARVINSQDDRYLQEELKSFLGEFLLQFYSYDESTFVIRAGRASDLMTKSLWDEQKAKLAEIQVGLAKEPLSQAAIIESLDLISDNKIEAILKIKIRQRLTERNIKLKVNLEIQNHSRTSENPWGYEIKELTDVVL